MANLPFLPPDQKDQKPSVRQLAAMFGPVQSGLSSRASSGLDMSQANERVSGASKLLMDAKAKLRKTPSGSPSSSEWSSPIASRSVSVESSASRASRILSLDLPDSLPPAPRTKEEETHGRRTATYIGALALSITMTNGIVWKLDQVNLDTKNDSRELVVIESGSKDTRLTLSGSLDEDVEAILQRGMTTRGYIEKARINDQRTNVLVVAKESEGDIVTEMCRSVPGKGDDRATLQSTSKPFAFLLKRLSQDCRHIFKDATGKHVFVFPPLSKEDMKEKGLSPLDAVVDSVCLAMPPVHSDVPFGHAYNVRPSQGIDEKEGHYKTVHDIAGISTNYGALANVAGFCLNIDYAVIRGVEYTDHASIFTAFVNSFDSEKRDPVKVNAQVLEGELKDTEESRASVLGNRKDKDKVEAYQAHKAGLIEGLLKSYAPKLDEESACGYRLFLSLQTLLECGPTTVSKFSSEVEAVLDNPEITQNMRKFAEVILGVIQKKPFKKTIMGSEFEYQTVKYHLLDQLMEMAKPSISKKDFDTYKRACKSKQAELNLNPQDNESRMLRLISKGLLGKDLQQMLLTGTEEERAGVLAKAKHYMEVYTSGCAMETDPESYARIITSMWTCPHISASLQADLRDQLSHNGAYNQGTSVTDSGVRIPSKTGVGGYSWFVLDSTGVVSEAYVQLGGEFDFANGIPINAEDPLWIGLQNAHTERYSDVPTVVVSLGRELDPVFGNPVNPRENAKKVLLKQVGHSIQDMVRSADPRLMENSEVVSHLENLTSDKVEESSAAIAFFKIEIPKYLEQLQAQQASVSTVPVLRSGHTFGELPPVIRDVAPFGVV